MNQKPDSTWTDEVRKALREPVKDPGATFTHSVMAQVSNPRKTTLWWSYGPIAGAAAALTLAIALFLLPRSETTSQRSAAEQIHSLVQEQQALERELQDLRHLRQSAAPVVYLGGDESVEFVYALNEPQGNLGSVRTADYRPARH